MIVIQIYQIFFIKRIQWLGRVVMRLFEAKMSTDPSQEEVYLDDYKASQLP